MMLPEHKERIISLGKLILNPPRTRPILDEQESDEIMRVLMESLGLRILAEFKMFHEFEDCSAIGVVERVDPYSRRFIIDGEWFKVNDIIGASIVGA
ncbi:YolD-like family protein [Cohnella yongneupensis]|uniref:YolD-like family protein n=1 Tax=Cohnella yongneupensis TaxID=425006 RepID=A0ABW0QTE4_9BACL